MRKATRVGCSLYLARFTHFQHLPDPWAPPPLTSGRGARTSGQACSVLSDQRSRAALLTFDCVHKSLESLLPCESELLGLGWSLRVCSANKLPGDATAAGPGWHFEEPGKVVGSPAMSVISQGFRLACPTPRATQLPSAPQHLSHCFWSSAPSAPAPEPHLEFPQALPFQLETCIAHTPGQADVEGRVLQRGGREAGGHPGAVAGQTSQRFVTELSWQPCWIPGLLPGRPDPQC